MKKDIFIDNDIAVQFTNPMDLEFKKLVNWLLVFNKDSAKDAYLVASQKLLEEYVSSSGLCKIDNNICLIVAKLQSQGRLITFTTKEIKEFRRIHFKKKIVKHLTCNYIDRDFHLPTVLLSDRHYALSNDDAFLNALLSFPGFTVLAVKKPELLNYSE